MRAEHPKSEQTWKDPFVPILSLAVFVRWKWRWNGWASLPFNAIHHVNCIWSMRNIMVHHRLLMSWNITILSSFGESGLTSNRADFFPLASLLIEDQKPLSMTSQSLIYLFDDDPKGNRRRQKSWFTFLNGKHSKSETTSWLHLTWRASWERSFD